MNSAQLHSSRQRNRLQSLLLATAMGLLLGSIGWLLGGWPVALGGLVAVVLGYHFSHPLSERILLRTHDARFISEREAAPLYRAVRTLSERAGIPTPRLYIFPHPSPNAFTTGSLEKPVLALSEGLLNRLQWEAVIGVLGHELSHIRHGDLQLMGFADLATRITAIFSLIGLLVLLVSLPLFLFGHEEIPWLLVLLLFLAPQLSIALQMALSRTREYEADRGSAELVGSPRPLIKALRRLDPPQLSLVDRLIFRRRLPTESSQIRSHPPTEERITRLEALDPRGRWSPSPLMGVRYRPGDILMPLGLRRPRRWFF